MSKPILSLGFTKHRSDFQLNVQGQFGEGITAIFGPSGSGKTTVLNCLAGLEKPDEGEIILHGRTLFSSGKMIDLPPEKRRIGYVFQDGLLFPHLGVKDNILYGFRRVSAVDRRILPEQLFDLLDLGPLLDRSVLNLSGGERQRVAIARALATSPELLLLDEPLASLDVFLQGRIIRYLKRLESDFSIPTLYVSHSMSEVAALAKNVLVLFRGKQVAFGEPMDVLSDPQVHPLSESAGLDNLLEAVVVKHMPEDGLTELKVGGSVLQIPYAERDLGKTILVSIRASDIILALDPPYRTSARNVIRVKLKKVQSVGPKVLVHVGSPVGLVAEISIQAASELNLMAGQDVFLIIKSGSVRALA